MSRLNVANFRHPDATADSVVITSDGDTQIQRALGLGGATYGTSGQVLTSAGSGAVPTWETPTETNLTRGTAVATTSGTSIDFSSLPSGIRRITLLMDNVQTNGTSRVCVRVGTGGTVETSGYSGTVRQDAASQSMDTSFEFDTAANATGTRQVTMFLHNVDGNTWLMSSLCGRGDGDNGSYAAGRIALSDTLDIVSITTFNGTDTFDGGTANIFYEV